MNVLKVDCLDPFQPGAWAPVDWCQWSSPHFAEIQHRHDDWGRVDSSLRILHLQWFVLQTSSLWDRYQRRGSQEEDRLQHGKHSGAGGPGDETEKWYVLCMEKAKIIFRNIFYHFQLPPSRLKMRSTREKLIKIGTSNQSPAKRKKKKIKYNQSPLKQKKKIK